MVAPRLEFWVDSPLTSVATFGETAITVVHTELTMESLRVATAINAKICAHYPDGVLALTVVQAGIQLPSLELRNAASEAMAATRTRTRAAARIFLGDGFWLSSVRSVLTAIELLRPYDTPRRTFSEVPAGTRWLQHQIHADAGWSERLIEAVNQVTRGPSDLRMTAT